jgi:hypothetical protein
MKKAVLREYLKNRDVKRIIVHHLDRVDNHTEIIKLEEKPTKKAKKVKEGK